MAAMSPHRYLLPLALILTGCAQSPDPGPERIVEQRATDASAPRGTALLRDTMIGAHNRARAAVNVPPLVWDDRLAGSARAYAEEMARTGRFAHADQPHGPLREGENLWTGTRGAYRYDEMIGHWVAERRDFVDRPTPAFSRTGRWEDVAHYTQIVWRNTQRIGCAMASTATDDYLVCRYSPAGNVVGQRAF
ncbi:CAP domain-containing protein [Sphingomonas sp. TZW2008]|uniref:CAP domain-containing protein n=1 Tax=Sphingomonas sp. TZW2008 TaxID=1917973 RepID=UPI000A269FC6|nr:CAP domain-containing protein [Sphingomonas sp. TZW2008]